jgi:hypothetical protein
VYPLSAHQLKKRNQMYENRKMRPTETILGMRGGEVKENDGEVEFNYDKLQEPL